MKVKELIKELKKHNPEAIVGTADSYGGCDEIESAEESGWGKKGSIKDIILR